MVAICANPPIVVLTLASHQFLDYLHLVPVLREQGTLGVPEGMPTDGLGDLGALRSRL